MNTLTSASADTPPIDAVRMIELLAIQADGRECFHGLRRGADGRTQALFAYGSIADPATAEKLLKWNLDGFDIYLTVHLVRAGVTRNPQDNDIEEGRALFLDSDGTRRPERWHVPPDFLLEREDDPARNWWAFWIIHDPEFPADQIKPYQVRLAALYGSDSSVSDRRRIVRLPGYIRHKANEAPGKSNKATADTSYRLVEGAGQ